MKTKVFIVTGFLGAGKATLVKRILSSSADLSKTIVLVNEFGKVGIDSALIKNTAAGEFNNIGRGRIFDQSAVYSNLAELIHQYNGFGQISRRA